MNASDANRFYGGYPHGHTDLLIVPRNLPNYEVIAARLAQFKPLQPSSSLVLDKNGEVDGVDGLQRHAMNDIAGKHSPMAAE